MATTPVPMTSITAAAPVKPQALWRFALTGLAPLTLLGLFALGVALFQRLA